MINGIHDFPLQFFQEVKIEKQTEEKLGMLIKGGLHGQPGNPHDESDEGVFIARINPGGHASRRSEELEVGQRIIEVNGQSLLGKDLFRTCTLISLINVESRLLILKKKIHPPRTFPSSNFINFLDLFCPPLSMTVYYIRGLLLELSFKILCFSSSFNSDVCFKN